MHQLEKLLEPDGPASRTFMRFFPSKGPAHALICLIHGLGEHSGRYHHVARFFNERGLALVAFDMLGHGNSAGQRGHFPGYPAMATQANAVIAAVRAEVAEGPLVLYGHSMGGNMVLNLVLRGLLRETPSALILSSPLFEPAFEPPKWKLLLGKAAYRLLPKLSLGNELDPAGLSRDEKVVEAYCADPLVHGRISARFLEVLEGGLSAMQQADRLPCPTLLMHGEQDPVTSVAASKSFAAGGQGCTLKLWPRLRHEIHQEPEQQDVFTFAHDWLVAQLEAAAATPVTAATVTR